MITDVFQLQEEEEEKFEPRFKTRGKSSSLGTYRRKQTHMAEKIRVSQQYLFFCSTGEIKLRILQELKRKKILAQQKETQQEEPNVKRKALDRFSRRTH